MFVNYVFRGFLRVPPQDAVKPQCIVTV